MFVGRAVEEEDREEAAASDEVAEGSDVVVVVVFVVVAGTEGGDENEAGCSPFSMKRVQINEVLCGCRLRLCKQDSCVCIRVLISRRGCSMVMMMGMACGYIEKKNRTD